MSNLIVDTRVLSRKVTIIAEAGINHNGDKYQAMDMVVEAKKAGADAIKFQLFTERARPRGKKFILSEAKWKEVMDVAISEKIECFWSVFDFESVAMAKRLGAKWVKLAFVERRNLELIQKCDAAGFERKFVSVDLQGQYPKCFGWEYLYCPNNGWSGYYPTNLDQIEWEEYSYFAGKNSMGYSCHSEDFYPCIVAASLGASVIEKHFKINNSCPDSDCSLNPAEFKTMVSLIEKILIPMMTIQPQLQKNEFRVSFHDAVHFGESPFLGGVAETQPGTSKIVEADRNGT